MSNKKRNTKKRDKFAARRSGCGDDAPSPGMTRIMAEAYRGTSLPRQRRLHRAAAEPTRPVRSGLCHRRLGRYSASGRG